MYQFDAWFPVLDLDDEIVSVTSEIRADCKLAGYDPESLHRDLVSYHFQAWDTVKIVWSTDVKL